MAWEKSSIGQFLVLAICFFSGPFLGNAIATRVTPGSDFAALVAFFVMPAALIAGFWLWFGFGLVTMAVDLVRRALAKGSGPSGRTDRIPPGHGGFVWVSAALGFLAGVLTGWAAPGGYGMAVGVWTGAGLVYGLVLRQLAATGWLVFPESE